MEGADQMEPQRPDLTAILHANPGLCETTSLLESVVSLGGYAIGGREGYRHPANQELMCGK